MFSFVLNRGPCSFEVLRTCAAGEPSAALCGTISVACGQPLREAKRRRNMCHPIRRILCLEERTADDR